MNKEIIEALGQIEKETGIAKDELIDMMKESVFVSRTSCTSQKMDAKY